MSVLIDMVTRWLLRQPAVRRFIADAARQEVRDALQNPESLMRRGMLRVIRSEAKDIFQEQAEAARAKIETSAEYERWARESRERVQSGAPADDPLTSPWDSTHRPLCTTCGAPIVWQVSQDAPAGGYWQHVSAQRASVDGAGLHVARYALADFDGPTQVLPVVNP